MYIGRFAPSPTGLLHIGSLLTALASYADARANGGKWLVRMEDLDPPREMAGAAAHILHTLEAFGFEWDGEVAYQSRREGLYQEALGRLKNAGLVYPCYCSRKDWQAAATAGADGFVYNGRCSVACGWFLGVSTCRGRGRCRTRNHAYRARTGFAGVHAASDLFAAMSRRKHAALRAPAFAGQFAGAEMVQANACSRFGFEPARSAFAASDALSRSSRCARG